MKSRERDAIKHRLGLGPITQRFSCPRLSLGRALALFDRVAIADLCSLPYPFSVRRAPLRYGSPIVRALAVGAELNVY